MREILLIVFVLSMFGTKSANGQNIIANPKSNAIIAKKSSGSNLVLSIEVDFINRTNNTLSPAVTFQIDNSTAPAVSQFNAADITNIKILNASQTINLNPYETKKAPNIFYLFIDKALIINYDKVIFLNLLEGPNLLCKIKVTIQPDDKVLSLDEYMEDKKKAANRIYRLDYVTKVESNNNIMTVSGYKKIPVVGGIKQNIFLKRNVELKEGKVFTVNELDWFGSSSYWRTLSISLITVPFKVRPSITSNGEEFNRSASSGISNIGFNLDLGKYQRDRYFSTGKKSTHKFSLGFWAAPSVEGLDSVNTGGYLADDVKSKQLFISTGITISYSYNDISFVFVPAGWDIGTSTIGKNWVYNSKRWWGFGIAISPKIFATILNK